MTKVKGSAQIETDQCKGCGLCVSVCSLKILVQQENTLNIKGYHPSKLQEPDKCMGCGQCASMCPDSVITVKRFHPKGSHKGRKKYA